MRTKAEAHARNKLFQDLTGLQKVMSEVWADQSLPDDWNYLETDFPENPARHKATLYIDQDVWRWFKKMGVGFHARINAVLRIYRNGVLSGDIKSHTQEYAHGPDRVSYLADMEDVFAQKLREMVKNGRLTSAELAKMEGEQRMTMDAEAAKKEILDRLNRIEAARGEVEDEY